MSDLLVVIRLPPKAARFAATACEAMAKSDLEDANDNSYYAAIAAAIRSQADVRRAGDA